MVEPDLSIRGLKYLRSLGDLGLGIYYTEYPLGSCHSALKLGYYTGYLIERLRVLVGIRKHSRQHTGSKRGIRYRGDRTDCRNDGVNYTVDEPRYRIRQRRPEDSLKRNTLEPSVYLIEFCLCFFATRVGLHGLLTRYHFVCEGSLLSPDLRLLAKEAVGFL